MGVRRRPTCILDNFTPVFEGKFGEKIDGMVDKDDNTFSSKRGETFIRFFLRRFRKGLDPVSKSF